MPVPPPPDPDDLDPLCETWPAGRGLYRVHRAAHEPDSFNAGEDLARFRPFRSGRHVVSTTYGAPELRTAIAESVFHDIDPTSDDPVVLRSALYGYVRSLIEPTRDLTLISLRGSGPRRLRTTARALVHTTRREYEATAAFARSLYAWPGRADGLIWDSRLYSGTPVVMLFGPRVGRSALRFSLDDVEPLWKGAGLTDVLKAAEESGITLLMSKRRR